MLREAWRRFEETVLRLEELPWGPGRTFALLAGIIAVRNLLEITVARNPVFPALAAFVHYPLAYLAPALALVLVLAAFSGVAPARVARLMALAWLLTLAPPLLDLLLHPAKDVPTIAYLQADPADLGWVFTHFFDPRVALPGTTPGIRLEALAAVLLGSLYVFLRSGKLLRALATAPAIYAVSLFFFCLPVLVHGAFRLFAPRTTRADILRGEGILFRPDPRTSFDSLAIAWLVPLLLLLLRAWRAAERGHEERWAEIPAGAGDPSPAGLPWLLAGTGLAGFAAARWLWLPPGSLTGRAPWDTLGLVALPLALVLAARGPVSLAANDRLRGTVFLVLAAALGAALGRGPAVGLVAVAGALLPLVPGILPRGPLLAAAAAVPVHALASLGAFAAGFALVTGPESLARIPRALIPAVLAWGALAAPAAVLAARLAPRPRLRPLVGALLGAAAFLGSWGILARPVPRETLRPDTRCVPRLALARAQQALEEGKLDRAVSGFREVLRCDPANDAALRQLAVVFARRGDLPKARKYFRKALEAGPENPANLANLAAAEMELGNLDEAIRLADEAYRRDPRDLVVLFNRAEALDRAGRNREAAAAWERYLRRAAPRPEEAESVRYARRRLKELRGREVRHPVEPPSRWAR